MNKQEIEQAIRDLTYKLKCAKQYYNMQDVKTYELAISALTQQLNNGWIPVSERLPEEKINPVTSDYYEYECTADWGCGRADVRYYKFGDGHWWNSPGCVDAYVIAWRERPEPYKEEVSE